MRNKRVAKIAAFAYLLAVFFSTVAMADGENLQISEGELGMMCVATAYPAVSRGNRDMTNAGDEAQNDENAGINGITDPNAVNIVLGQAGAKGDDAAQTESDTNDDGGMGTVVSPPALPAAGNGQPLVIIYHTHATEAYQPISTGNFRTTEVEGSVRDVGNVLAEELEKLGIGVVHDTTLHDAESYNKSYSRSLETANYLISQYPSAIFVIDLHRDAAAYTGGAAKTVTIDGKTVASYALVVGEGNPNASALKAFANAVNDKAEEMYPGFGGRIISKSYKYNQYVSDYHLLLEIGNNENNIKETRLTAKYFAHVLASVIEDTL